jgi:hypothetical protein
MTEAATKAPVVRCQRCSWPAFRGVTITTDAGNCVYGGPTCRACLDSFQQDGRYFTATIQIGPVVADADKASEWFGAPRPASMTEDERGRQVYRISADVRQALEAVPGWQVERSGVCVSVRFKGHGVRRSGDGPDYWVWVEDATDMHLHKAIEAGVRRQIRDEERALAREERGR